MARKDFARAFEVASAVLAAPGIGKTSNCDGGSRLSVAWPRVISQVHRRTVLTCRLAPLLTLNRCGWHGETLPQPTSPDLTSSHFGNVFLEGAPPCLSRRVV